MEKEWKNLPPLSLDDWHPPLLEIQFVVTAAVQVASLVDASLVV